MRNRAAGRDICRHRLRAGCPITWRFWNFCNASRMDGSRPNWLDGRVFCWLGHCISFPSASLSVGAFKVTERRLAQRLCHPSSSNGTIIGLPESRRSICMGAATVTRDLEKLTEGPHVHRNLSTPQLIEAAIARGEASLASNGSLVALTGSRTGRSPRDKFMVEDAETKGRVDWGRVNQPFSPD